MSLSASKIRKQLLWLKPILNNCSLKTIRKGQNIIGDIMASKKRAQVIRKEHRFDNFDGLWMIPKDERRQGIILYLHGGGFTCGDIEYAAGFASVLAVECGARVFSAAYRLAPENPYPAALDDALEAYRYLIGKGYSHDKITLCGESAGGGLCYSLCLKLKQEGLPLPCGIIALSPWSDLTLSGESYETNAENDPSMTRKLLDFFAANYTADRKDPLVSPLFGDLCDMPESLIFVGEDEIMLDDSVKLHEALLASGSKSKLTVTPERWHAYLLYSLKEDRRDFLSINRFLNRVMSAESKLRWLPLDNAAKIYPAARRESWSNVFRLSATLTEEVDVELLQSTLDITVRRFPSIAVKLCKGVFWYYLQQLSDPPKIRSDSSYPLTRMTKEETRKCAFRVLVYKKRIAVEIFHSLTDGTGALIFLKSLVAEYLHQKHGVHIPAEYGVLGRLDEPCEAELEDSFQKHSGVIAASRKETTAWRVGGTPDSDGFLTQTCIKLSSSAVLKKAHEYGVSATAFLSAVMMKALQDLQAKKIPDQNKRKPVKVLIPVNLRPIFKSATLRNFAMYTIPEILPALGEYSFEEICAAVKHRMGLDINRKHMSMMIAANVNSERIMAVRLMPLFIKNFVMKAIFDSVGERKSCLSLSNLGAVRLPDEMAAYVERMDFILGVQASAPYNCGVLSYGGNMYINFIRNIKESELEYHFYLVLRDMGIEAEVQTNRNE
ncbi:MAG: alpha/beta hydrolase fold domain-containing protein [Clostridia bacterium]|nr:alpha/beta hydrolase fold domain-containing protein [Clostridia bacterium]